MQAVVFRKSNRTVVTVVKDVVRIEGNNIFGVNSSAEGINFDEADIIVSDASDDFKLGQVVPSNIIDHKAQFITQTPEERNADIEQRLADMELAMAEMFIG